MEHKLKSILSGTGFYLLLAVCLITAAVSGWFLLFGRDEPAVEEAAPQAAVSAPVESAYVPQPEPEPEEDESPVEASAPVEVEIVPTMPEAEIDDTPVMAEPPQLVVEPLKGEVLMAFSVDQLVYNETLADWRTHDGVDIRAEAGTPVVSAAAGTVSSVEEAGRMGTTVTVEHQDGYVTTYASLQPETGVLKGDEIAAGAVLGAVGNTSLTEAGWGAHLHFSVSKDGELVDPAEFLGE